MQMTTMLVGEGAKLDVHGCKTVDMASSFGKALLEFVFIVFACITLLIGINAAKSKAAGRVLFPATFVTGIASISYFSMASGGGWVIAPDCRQLFVARYMDWLITTPLLLIDLGIVAGVSRWDIMALCLSDSACSPLSYAKILALRQVPACAQRGWHTGGSATHNNVEP
jgi:bacteriorhodopsin